VGGKGGGGGRGEKWPKPCMHIWIIKKNPLKGYLSHKIQVWYIVRTFLYATMFPHTGKQ
jgi:hypothetical protein